MANQEEYFTCPCCGMKAPMKRLTEDGPYSFEMFLQEYGGKRALTAAERKARRGESRGKGSGVGLMTWTQIDVQPQHQDAIDKRISELSQG